MLKFVCLKIDLDAKNEVLTFIRLSWLASDFSDHRAHAGLTAYYSYPLISAKLVLNHCQLCSYSFSLSIDL
jgi:hypothetical protein